MKRKLIAFSMSMALLLSVFSAANVGAHTAYIEALNPTNPNGPTPNRGEWFGVVPTGGIGAVQRDDALRGEFVYNDPSKDQRLINLPSGTTKITKEVDLNWFSVTADANNLYMLAKVDVYCCITNNPALELMVSIDTTHTSGTGTRPLPNVLGASGSTVGISVTADAAWEYVVDAKFTNGNGVNPFVTATPKIYTNLTTSSDCTITTSGCGAQLVSTNGNFAEISIPWSKLGGQPTGGSYLRFNVATLYSNHATAPDTAAFTPIMDVIDDGSQTTEQDLQDRVINTSFDVHFDPVNNEEVYAPLQITEFQPNPVGTDNPGPTNPSTDSEWIEIYNPNAFAIPLSDYKIGNAAKRNSGQGMFKFKAATIAPNSTIIVARFKSRFLAGNPPVPLGVPVYGLDVSTDFTRYTQWATGTTIDLDNAPGVPPVGTTNSSLEEQVVLLDGKDGIVDLVNYGTPPAPTAGNIPINIVSVPEGVSFERCPGTRDTNGGWKANSQTQLTNNIEFIPRGAGTNLLETPGTVCLGRPGIDMQVAKSGPSTADKGDTIQYTITYGNYGANSEPGTVVVTDTLPTGITFTNSPGNASPAPLSVNGQTLTWNFPTGLPGNTTGTIVLTATINIDVAPSTQLVNQVGISSTNEPAEDQTNNLGTQTLTTLGPPVLGVTLSGLHPVLPGKQFSYTIGYNNIGGNEANDVTITGTIPAGVTLNGSTADGATSNFSTPVTGPATVTWTVSQLASNASGVIVVNATVGSSVAVDTSLAFSASAKSDDPVVGVTAGPVNGSLKVGLRKLYLPIQLR
jgi:uncharacterized repeat protein (TIGR01451 family)